MPGVFCDKQIDKIRFDINRFTEATHSCSCFMNFQSTTVTSWNFFWKVQMRLQKMTIDNFMIWNFLIVVFCFRLCQWAAEAGSVVGLPAELGMPVRYRKISGCGGRSWRAVRSTHWRGCQRSAFINCSGTKPMRKIFDESLSDWRTILWRWNLIGENYQRCSDKTFYSRFKKPCNGCRAIFSKCECPAATLLALACILGGVCTWLTSANWSDSWQGSTSAKYRRQSEQGTWSQIKVQIL